MYEILKTDMYKANKAWIEKLNYDGYTIIDMGNPHNVTEMSPFYSMEKMIIFGE